MSAVDPSPVEVRRSRRRSKTVTAFREGRTIVVMIPARMSKAEERRWVATMVERVTAAEQRRRPSDTELLARARVLSERYLDGLASPASVRWAKNQRSRWGSCTPIDASIRLSSRLQGMPAYVVDYVLLHELTHLIVSDHSKRFWQWVDQYELTERARGFLEGVAASPSLPLGGPAPSDEAAGAASADLFDDVVSPDDDFGEGDD